MGEAIRPGATITLTREDGASMQFVVEDLREVNDTLILRLVPADLNNPDPRRGRTGDSSPPPQNVRAGRPVSVRPDAPDGVLGTPAARLACALTTKTFG